MPLLNEFLSATTGFYFKARRRDLTTSPISAVTNLGAVSTTIDHGLAAGQRVRLMRLKTPFRSSPNGVYTVTSATAREFTVFGWPATVIASGGRARRDEMGFQSFNEGQWEPVRVGVKKVGRPFARFSGRASRRT